MASPPGVCVAIQQIDFILNKAPKKPRRQSKQRRRSPTSAERDLAAHSRMWRDWLISNDRFMSPVDPARHDIRYYEAMVCGFSCRHLPRPACLGSDDATPPNEIRTVRIRPDGTVRRVGHFGQSHATQCHANTDVDSDALFSGIREGTMAELQAARWFWDLDWYDRLRLCQFCREQQAANRNHSRVLARMRQLLTPWIKTSPARRRE